jgi:hypothetical protein
VSLKPLSITDAIKLATALGQNAIGDFWKRDWSTAIVGSGSDDEARREPLAVRVAVDLLARAETDRDALADEIRKTGVGANEDFVARIYQKRIVDHVRDPLAQKLAWPGLVVRRVTLEIVHELLAPLCDIAPEDAEKAFRALSQEVWMVTREGDALRHLPVLRARTLPLMKRKDPKEFEKVAEAAVVYFESHRERSREDFAEWIYHRLLADQSPASVARDVKVDVLPLLARAEADFPPESAAASYLASRTAKKRLSVRRISTLLPSDALYHLSVTSPDSFALDDEEIDKPTLDVSERIRGDDLADNDLDAWARALWIKTGAWQRMPSSIEFADDMTKPQLRAHLFWAARVALTLDTQRRGQLFEECQRLTLLPNSTEDRVGLRTAVQMMAFARIVGSTTFAVLDNGVNRMLAQAKPSSIPSMQAALRTAIIFGQSCRKPALGLWLASRRRGSSERVLDPTVSLAELDQLIRVHPDAAELLGNLKGIDRNRPIRIADEIIVASVSRVLDEILGDLGDDAEGQRSQDVVSRIFARRDEDWIVPFGYAAARATHCRLSGSVLKRLAGYAPTLKRARKSAPSIELPRDPLAAMSLADEAGDLVGFARLLLAESDQGPQAMEDLSLLLECQQLWSEAITDVIGTESSASEREKPPADTEKPPTPGPVIDPVDPQKGRWGGKDRSDGRAVWAVIESVERDVFYFSVIVESTDESVLEPPVVFHMHDTYRNNVVRIRRIINQKQARLSEWESYGVFAIGVQVKNSAGEWIALELDLANTKGLPKRFLAR